MTVQARVCIGPLLAACALGLAPATTALATMVPRAEKGAVALSADAPGGLAAPVNVSPGEVAWTETYHPMQAVRLLSPAARRIRPNLPGLPAGTIMFGYQLPSGVAYCPRIDFRAATPDTQCLRDFDGDGTFDGGYYVDWRGDHSSVLAEVLQGLVAIPKVHYIAIDGAAELPTPGAVIFEGFQHGRAMFRVRIEQVSLDTKDACVPLPDGDCAVLGLTLRVTPRGPGASIALISAASGRELNVVTAGGPDISGFDRHPRSGNGQ